MVIRQIIFNYLKCIADGDAAGDGNISKCVAKLILSKRAENEKSLTCRSNTIVLELPNCGKTAPVVGGSEKKYTRKKKKKSTKGGKLEEFTNVLISNYQKIEVFLALYNNKHYTSTILTQ